MSCLDDLVKVATVAQGFIAVFTLPTIAWQLWQSHEAQRAQAFMELVGLEANIHAATDKLLDVATDSKPGDAGSTAGAEDEPQQEFEAYEELRFNLYERLCSGFVHGFLDEIVLKEDYEKVIAGLARRLKGNNDYPHIHHVANAWEKKASARRTFRLRAGN